MKDEKIKAPATVTNANNVDERAEETQGSVFRMLGLSSKLVTEGLLTAKVVAKQVFGENVSPADVIKVYDHIIDTEMVLERGAANRLVQEIAKNQSLNQNDDIKDLNDRNKN